MTPARSSPGVHEQGVLHRDLKPANIMVSRGGRAQLMDFGIAATGDTGAAGRVMEGTPLYMAPEQLRGEAVTPQSDIYALGLVMYEIFTGRRLHASPTLDELRTAQLELAPVVTRALDGVVPARLREAVLRCLEPDPSNRPASVRDAAALLQTVLLDAVATWRRVAQVGVQMLFAPLLIGTVVLLLRPGDAAKAGALTLAVILAVIVLLEKKFPLGWALDYKGHRIRFVNHPAFGERLYIDGTLADRGRVGINVTLRGTIESGAGAGERITADVKAGVTRLACRIVSEAFL